MAKTLKRSALSAQLLYMVIPGNTPRKAIFPLGVMRFHVVTDYHGGQPLTDSVE